MLSFIKDTTQSVVMQNSVYIPTGQVADAFNSLRERNIPASILTNQDIVEEPEIFSQVMEWAIFWAAERDSYGTRSIHRLSSRGEHKIGYELTLPNVPVVVHSKTAIRDGRDATVGSFNLDPQFGQY